jgi:hypothetical protein
MFCYCSSLTSLSDITKWKLNKGTNIKDLFYGCSSLFSKPDVSKWDLDDNNNSQNNLSLFG